ncbi:hypothetical protein [Kaarinaea lacus]
MESHLNTCRSCQNEFQQMQRLANQLKQIRPDDFHYVSEPHLTDEEILSYINISLDRDILHRVQSHIDECVICMKAVLRHRAYLAENVRQTSTPTNEQTTAAVATETAEINAEVVNLAQPTSDNRRGKILIPFALAATVLLSVVVVSRFYPNLMEYQVAHRIPADIVVAEQQPGPSTADSFGIARIMPVASSGKNGVNWYQGYIETTAVGTADMGKMKNRVQAEIVAEKTARHLGYAQLAEILKGVQITSTSTYEDLLLKVDNLSVQSEGFIRGAQVIDKHIEWEDGVPKASVTLRAPLYGQNSVRSLIESTVPEQHKNQTPLQHANLDKNENPQTGKFSNIIIDASGLDFTPALFVDMQTPSSEIINASTQGQSQPAYRFYPDIQSAKASAFAGESPAIIKAQAPSKAGRLVLNETDALLAQAIVTQAADTAEQPVLVVF